MSRRQIALLAIAIVDLTAIIAIRQGAAPGLRAALEVALLASIAAAIVVWRRDA